MVFLFAIFIQAFALTCNMSCLNLCSENSSESCIKDCCPGVVLIADADCELKCEEIGGVYECSEICIESEYACQNNCDDFCDSRADNCYETCSTVFCEQNQQETNWTFIIGLILLATAFVIVLYSRIVYINNKVFQEEFRDLI